MRPRSLASLGGPLLSSGPAWQCCRDRDFEARAFETVRWQFEGSLSAESWTQREPSPKSKCWSTCSACLTSARSRWPTGRPPTRSMMRCMPTIRGSGCGNATDRHHTLSARLRNRGSSVATNLFNSSLQRCRRAALQKSNTSGCGDPACEMACGTKRVPT